MGLLLVSLLVFVRVCAVTMTAPILGSNAVAIRTRLGVAVAISLLALPLVQMPPGMVESIGNQTDGKLSGRFFSWLLSEATIGIAMGLSVSIMWSAASSAGSVISQMAGMNIGDQPGASSGNEGGPIGRLFCVLALAAFAIIGGPAIVMSAVLDTFVHLPLGVALAADTLPMLVADLLQQSFMLMLRAVGPVVVALLASNIVIGIISRTYPQMNLLGLGLSSNMVVMMLSVFLTVGGTVWLFVDDVKPTLEWTQSRLKEAVVTPDRPSFTEDRQAFLIESRVEPIGVRR